MIVGRSNAQSTEWLGQAYFTPANEMDLIPHPPIWQELIYLFGRERACFPNFFATLVIISWKSRVPLLVRISSTRRYLLKVIFLWMHRIFLISFLCWWCMLELKIVLDLSNCLTRDAVIDIKNILYIVAFCDISTTKDETMISQKEVGYEACRIG